MTYLCTHINREFHTSACVGNSRRYERITGLGLLLDVWQSHRMRIEVEFEEERLWFCPAGTGRADESHTLLNSPVHVPDYAGVLLERLVAGRKYRDGLYTDG